MKILITSSSRDEIAEEYLKLADTVCERIIELKKDIELVFGAANTGMMGRCTRYFDKVYSYTVEKYVSMLKDINSTKEYILETSFDRTKEMYKESDVILVLPGGTGSLAEIFGIIEENRSIDNPKPMIIYNYNHYYDKVIEIINDCITNKFNSNSITDYFYISDDLDIVMQKIKDTIK